MHPESSFQIASGFQLPDFFNTASLLACAFEFI